jgi:hypothetical protein
VLDRPRPDGPALRSGKRTWVIGREDVPHTLTHVLDDSASRDHFSMEPTPWDEACRRTVEG